MRRLMIGVLCGAGLTLAPAAYAQAGDKTWTKQTYVGGSLGYLDQSESDNSGRTGAFTTGNGSPVIPNGTAIAAGTPYGWNTEFEESITGSLEGGVRTSWGLRTGLEVAYSQADVDTHSGVRVGGVLIDGVDAAVLTGSATQLGATVGQVVADGRGEISNTALFANLYYHFGTGRIQPYLGAGIGFSQVEVNYQPSGVLIIDDDETKVAYQLKAGAEAMLSDAWSVYGEYAFRKTEEVEFGNRLFPGTLEIENEQSVFSVGVRYTFQ
jgi:opacity protein-like surface antigen